MISRSNCFVVLLLALSLYGLFQIKYKVLELKRETKALASRLDSEKRECEALKVEWTYLTNPQRVALLAAKYLNLSKTHVDQISAVQSKNIYKVSDFKKNTKILNVSFKKQHGNWRYRKDVHGVGKSFATQSKAPSQEKK
jgi:hypothetical protein